MRVSLSIKPPQLMATGAALFCSLIVGALQPAFTSDSYEAFRQTHGRATFGALGEENAVNYKARRALFRQRHAEVLFHNVHNRSWKKAINRFSDYTDAELRVMLGYKRVGGRWGAPAGASSFIEEHEYEIKDNEELASEVDWRQNLQKTSAWVRNQGACGSCWAVAAVGALEMHAEKKHGVVKRLSLQQIVDCVQNPRHCGGTGGCHGATGEEAFEFARSHGISTEDTYHSEGGKCNTRAPSSLKVARFVRLPENKATYLKTALATKGPAVVSVDGGSWFSYGGGVFSGCEKDTVVNHAVLAVGYGSDPSSRKDYWTIRNSWGEDWGEKGFMRVERHINDDDYCGIDNKPKEGVFCDDAPASVPVCGMCGITSDSSYPNVHPTRGFIHHRNMRSKLSDWSQAAEAHLSSGIL